MTQFVFPGTLSELSGENHLAIDVPSTQKWILAFSVNASRPQGVGIYDHNGFRYAERYSTANFESIELKPLGGSNTTTYYLTGWAFYPSGAPGGTWIQSEIQETIRNKKISFDDYIKDGDFNDLVIDITISALTDEDS